VVQRSTVVDTSMYRLCSGGEPGGGETVGWAVAIRGRRGGGELVSMVTLHGMVARGRSVGGDSGWSGCGRGKKLGYVGVFCTGK
jgi:hypothetical protein